MKKFKYLSVFSTSLLLLSSNIAIAQDTIEPKYTQRGMEQSAGSQLQILQKNLDKLYHQILSKIKGEAKNDFIKAQQNWLKFVQSEAAFQASTSGSIAPTIANLTATDLYKARLQDFKHYLNCHGNPKFCPIMQ